VVRLIAASGGGYGDPLRREAEKVVMDVRNEFITVEQARDDYGVIIDPQTLAVEGFTPARIQKGEQ